MIPLITGAMLAVSNSLAASIVVKATLAAALGLLAARMLRRSRAAVRHALLAAAFGVMLMLPIASVLAPPVRIPLARMQDQTAHDFAGADSAIGATVPAQANSAVASQAQSSGFSWPALLLTTWLAGTAIFLLPMAIGLWQVRSLRRSALPWTHGQSLVDTLARAAGISRSVKVLLHEALPGPMTCGLVHPAVVLPQEAQTWAPDDLNRALLHEMEHVRRGDWAICCLARAVCAAYWFHPLVWIAWRRLALEAERACDDAVLRRSEAAAYADQLVGLARRLQASAKPPLLAMANRADLSARVGAVLDARQRRGRAGKFIVALACAAGAALVLTISPLRMVAAPQSPSGAIVVTPSPRFTASDMLVIEDVTVTGTDGKPIEGLAAGDFTVTEDGVSQVIGIFEFQKLSAAPQASPSSYYILGYYTRNDRVDGSFRKVHITCKAPSARLDYRSGYYASKRFIPANGVPPADPGPTTVNRNASPSIFTYPELIRKVEPEYSEAARKAKFQGNIVLSVEVDASGQVTNPKVIKGLGLGLDEKALETIRQWKFKPGSKNGKPVAMQVEVEMSFRLL